VHPVGAGEERVTAREVTRVGARVEDDAAHGLRAAEVMAGGIAATLVIGALAGLYPAIRAARLAPTEALATT
jgi:hypothetical protein